MVDRVLLVEDHPALRQALAFFLEREPDLAVVAEAGSLAEAGRMLEDIDLAIIDLKLPDGNGADLIEGLLQNNPDARVLVLTASIDRAEFGRVVESGAAGVLHKTAGLRQILDAVKRLRKGESLHPTREIVELLKLRSRCREQERLAKFAASRLTPREYDVLQALADGLGSSEIAERLGISRETEHAHMVRIFAKLGVHSRVSALVFALRHNLVEISPASPKQSG